MLVLNVRSLAARMQALMELPFDIMCLSEVRASHNTIRALSRVAAKNGFSVVWSRPPPPTATFSVALGGTAIIVLELLLYLQKSSLHACRYGITKQGYVLER